MLLDYIKKYIDLYQMPLFFSLSGYLFAMRWKDRKPSAFIVNKIKRLIVPFFSIALLWMIPIKMILHYPYYDNLSYFGAIHKLLNGTDLGHLWYLPTLFIIFIGMYYALKLAGNKKTVWLFAFVITIVLNLFRQYIPPFEAIYLLYICQYMWSFTLGGVIYHFNLDKTTGCLKYIGIGITLVLSVFCIFNSWLNSLAASILIVISIYMIMPENENNIMNVISEYSFGVYLIHSPLIYITFTYMLNASPIIVVALNFLVFGSMSFAITHFIKKKPIKFIIGS